MRGLGRVLVASLLALAASGCIMVIGGAGVSTKVGKHKRVVQIDDQLYIIDLEKNTAKKLEKEDLPEGTTMLEIETSKSDD